MQGEGGLMEAPVRTGICFFFRSSLFGRADVCVCGGGQGGSSEAVVVVVVMEPQEEKLRSASLCSSTRSEGNCTAAMVCATAPQPCAWEGGIHAPLGSAHRRRTPTAREEPP